MAGSVNEAIYWLKDVRQHLRVAQQRKALRRPGQGFNYTKDEDSVRRVIQRLHPERMRLRVVDILQATPTTKTFWLEHTGGPPPPFRPGQYINVFVDVDGVLTSRPYSIASAPGEEFLELTVKDNPGGFVAPYLLNEVRVGDELETTGPKGHFYYEPLIDGEDLIFLAGGSGITPFMCIIRDTVRRERPLKIHLLYGSRTPDEVIYGDELARLSAKHPDFDYSLVISEPSRGYQGLAGLLDADLIRDQVGDLKGKTFYICGPPVMCAFCLAALEELGVPYYRIKRELFGPMDDVTKEPGWPEGLTSDTVFMVEVVGHKGIHAPAGEPLMNTLERYGIVVPAVCRVGECSTCRVRLLSGQVFMPQSAGIREADRQYGFIHACVSYPLEDLQIRLLS